MEEKIKKMLINLAQKEQKEIEIKDTYWDIENELRELFSELDLEIEELEMFDKNNDKKRIVYH